MPFNNIISQWQAQGRTADSEIASRALSTLQTERQEGFKSLDTDPNIPDARREELLEQLKRVNPTAAHIVTSTVETFCYAHLGIGPKNGKAKRSTLGHVTPRAKFEERLKSAHDRNATFPITARPGSAPRFLDIVLGSNLAAQKTLLGENHYLADRHMWSFYQPTSSSAPFSGVSKRGSDLRNRLGLGHIAESHPGLLLWSHRLEDHQEATIPTALDAAINEYFRPGGRTYPLGAPARIATSGGHNGLDEVVHPTITASQLVARIEEST